MEIRMVERRNDKTRENSTRYSVDLSRRVATLRKVRTGTEVGVRASPEEFDFHLHTVIYRLLEADGESDYSGPFMIDAEGIVRVAGVLDESRDYAFIIEALSSDGESVQSDVQTLSIGDILDTKH
jgi:hypothetical protein